MLLKPISPCEWPKLDALPGCPHWNGLCFIQPFRLCHLLWDVDSTWLVPAALCCSLWELLHGRSAVPGSAGEEAAGTWNLILIPTLHPPLFSESVFKNNFWYLWSGLTWVETKPFGSLGSFWWGRICLPPYGPLKAVFQYPFWILGWYWGDSCGVSCLHSHLVLTFLANRCMQFSPIHFLLPALQN